MNGLEHLEGAFKYIRISEAEVLAEVSGVRVVGHPDVGCYEWVYGDQHSNCGYGSIALAMRDGLNVFLGES